MSEYLPKEVREGLSSIRAAAEKKRHRMRIRVGGQELTVLRQWSDGFSVDAQQAHLLRGLVDLYDGSRHVSQCLIVATSEDDGEMSYEYKRATPCVDGPPRDYEVAYDAPVALIEKRV